MTTMQWEALLAASRREIKGAVHGKTFGSLLAQGLLEWYPGVGHVPTIRGRNLLHGRFAAGLIGPRGAGAKGPVEEVSRG